MLVGLTLWSYCSTHCYSQAIKVHVRTSIIIINFPTCVLSPYQCTLQNHSSCSFEELRRHHFQQYKSKWSECNARMQMCHEKLNVDERWLLWVRLVVEFMKVAISDSTHGKCFGDLSGPINSCDVTHVTYIGLCHPKLQLSKFAISYFTPGNESNIQIIMLYILLPLLSPLCDYNPFSLFLSCRNLLEVLQLKWALCPNHTCIIL